MVEKYQKLVAIIIAIAIVAVGSLVYWNLSSESRDSIFVYCGAGLRKPMEEIGNQFEENYSIRVEYNYAGSNTLLSQMELNQEGDVYMPGATYYIETADDKGFIGNMSLIAYHTPVIVVSEGNPKNITSLEDLTRPDLEIVLGDPGAAAAGKVADQILENNGLLEEVNQNVISRTATVNELVVYLAQGQADAGICWQANLYGLEDELDKVDIPEEQNIIKILPIGTLTFSENDADANLFIEFVEEHGKDIFVKYGFNRYDG